MNHCILQVLVSLALLPVSEAISTPQPLHSFTLQRAFIQLLTQSNTVRLNYGYSVLLALKLAEKLKYITEFHQDCVGYCCLNRKRSVWLIWDSLG